MIEFKCCRGSIVFMLDMYILPNINAQTLLFQLQRRGDYASYVQIE